MLASEALFTLSQNDCPDTVTGANVKFDGTSDGVNQNLLALDNGTGIATGVGIEIADKNGTAIPLHTASPDYTLAAGANSLDFIARYVSTGAAVTTGTANGTSQFTINYKEHCAVAGRILLLLPMRRRITGSVSQGCVFFVRR